VEVAETVEASTVQHLERLAEVVPQVAEVEADA
jgi:hypothetical protein